MNDLWSKQHICKVVKGSARLVEEGSMNELN